MASVWTESRDRGYVVRWRDEHGKHTSPAYGSKAEALAAARDLRARLGPSRRRRRGAQRPVEKVTLVTIAQAWRVEKRADRPGRDTYLNDVVEDATRVARELGWTTPKDANPDAVRHWLAVHNGRGRRSLAYLRVLLRWAAREMDQPLDPRLDRLLAAPQSREADVELPTEGQVADWLRIASTHGQGLLVDCLATYGWRPITAARLTVADFDPAGTIRLALKGQSGPWRHPLFAWHVEQFRSLAANRSKEEPLLLSPDGDGWRYGEREDQDQAPAPVTPGEEPKRKGAESEIAQWFRANCGQLPGERPPVYQLKRYAISRMDSGAAPWRRRLSIAEIQLFTGHRTKTQVLRYLRTSLEHARELVDATRAEVSARGGTGGGTEGAVSVPPRPPVVQPARSNVLQFPGLSFGGPGRPGL